MKLSVTAEVTRDVPFEFLRDLFQLSGSHDEAGSRSSTEEFEELLVIYLIQDPKIRIPSPRSVDFSRKNRSLTIRVPLPHDEWLAASRMDRMGMALKEMAGSLVARGVPAMAKESVPAIIGDAKIRGAAILAA